MENIHEDQYTIQSTSKTKRHLYWRLRWYIATNWSLYSSLHLTTMCLQYKPTVVACFCIHLASKWSSWEIPLSSEQKEWFSYVDPTVTADLLQQLTEEFLVIFENSPSRLKEKIIASENLSNYPDNPVNFTMVCKLWSIEHLNRLVTILILIAMV